jgi:hypothetical protein
MIDIPVAKPKNGVTLEDSDFLTWCADRLPR